MKFIVTARKWRPQLFSEVVGQHHISTTLKNAIENNRLGHAYIFAGPRGVGKTTTARILAKRLNCTNPNGGEPCNKCSSCQNFLKSQSLDIIEIDGASNRRIDEIRTLRESVKYAPTSGQYKIYIIDEVHMLTTESFNALLKTLEEPPEHTIFIFATTDIHKVPLTIISRCQRFDFKRIELIDIKDLLAKISEEENIKIDDESLTLIAKKADGALRDAESIFDQVVSFCGNVVDAKILKQMLNIIDEEIYFHISDAVLNKEFNKAFEISELINSNGWNFIDFLNGLIEHFRNISSVVITNNSDFIESSDSVKAKYLQYRDKFSNGDLLRLLHYLNKSQNELRISQNQKLKTEILLTHLIGFERSSTISELLSGSEINATNKKKTEILSEKKVPPVKIEFKQNTDNTPKNNSNPISKKPKPKDNSHKTENVITTVSKNEIDSKWKQFKEVISKERFTLGPLLTQTLPSKIEDNTLSIDVNHKEDVQILSSAKDFLSKRFNEIFNIRLSLQFNFNNIGKLETSKTNNLDSEPNDEYGNHPLIKSVIEELGGREIK